MGDRGPPDIGGLISLKVDNFPFEMSCARLSYRSTPQHPAHSLSPGLPAAVAQRSAGGCAAARRSVHAAAVHAAAAGAGAVGSASTSTRASASASACACAACCHVHR